MTSGSWGRESFSWQKRKCIEVATGRNREDHLAREEERLACASDRGEQFLSFNKPVATSPVTICAFDFMPTRAVRRAEELIRAERYHEAAAQLEDLLEEDPENTEILNDLGVALFKMGAWDRALDTYIQAVERAPTRSMLWENLGEVIRKGDVAPERLETVYERLRSDRVMPSQRSVLKHIGQKVRSVTPYRAAHAHVDITPEGKCVTQGWLGAQEVDKVIDRLRLQALLLEDEKNNKVLVLAADLLGVGDTLLAMVRAEARQWGIPPEAVVFNASHTHYAPGTVERVVPGLGSHYPDYVRQIGRVIQQLLPHLHDHLQPALVCAGATQVQVGSNRRRKDEAGEVVMAPNPDGYYHKETPLCVVDLLDQEASVVLVNHGCHPTGSGRPAFLSPGYPGHVRKALVDAGVADSVMFLQGAAGSTKLARNGSGQLQFTSSPAEAAAQANTLATAVSDAIDTALAPVQGPVFARIERLKLPLHEVPTEEQLRAMPVAEQEMRRVLEEQWAQHVLSESKTRRDALDLDVQLVGLGEDVGFITFPGEPVAELARNILDAVDIAEHTFMLGYTNGLKAYLPTKQIVEDGGYEGDEASMVYLLPATFKPAVEEEIVDGVERLVAAWRDADRPNGYGRYHLMEEQGEAFFCLSTGRCGTKTLAYLLKTATNARVYHHPRPYLVEETLAAYQDEIDQSQVFWQARGNAIRDAWKDGLVFGETDHNMTAFAEAIDEEVEEAKYIVLVRNPWDFVRSGMRRQYYKDHPWDVGRLRPSPGHPDYDAWHRMTRFEKVCWLWKETYRRIGAFVEELPADKYRIVQFESLINDKQKTAELFDFLRLRGFDDQAVQAILGRKLNRQKQGTYERPIEWAKEKHNALWALCQPVIEKLSLTTYNDMYTSYLEDGGDGVSRDATASSINPKQSVERPGLRADETGQPQITTTTIWDYKKFKYQAYPEAIAPADIVSANTKRPLINRKTPIASMGSCFARNVAKYLLKRGFNYLVTEKPFQQASAHWDQVFNTACMRQIFEYSLTDAWDPVVRWWSKGEKVQDPYRRDILYPADTCEEHFARHREASRKAIQEARVIILTLGLIETWRDQRDQATYYRVPSPSIYDPDTHEFYVQTVQDCTQDLDAIHDLLQEANPTAEIVVTVSPVPLFATFRMDVDVVSANRLSKSTLRVAAEYFAQKHDNVHYFPAYEIVTQGVDQPYEADNRHVTDDTIASVMRSFEVLFAE